MNFLLRKNANILILLLICTISKAQSRLYIANDDHTDYMTSVNEVTYDSAFVQMIDAWMAINNASNGNPADFQTKFNCDGSYWAWAYQKSRTPAQFQAFVDQVKNERITVPMNPLIITYGCVPAEAVLRGMYYAGELQRKYNLKFEIAQSMENQVMPLGLASLWSGSGAKYDWHGVCNCATLVPGLNNPRQKEMYWYKGLDGNGVLMKWYSFTGPGSLGGYAEAADPATAISKLTDKVNTTDYNYNIAAAFGFGGDALETTTDQLAAAAQLASNASRRVIVSNELDFFRDFETNYGATLPTLTQTFGNEWETPCAAIAEVSANIKRSLEKLRSAEAMATIVARTDPSFANSLDSLRRLAWMSIGLYWEHDFGGFSPERGAWERRQEENFTGYVNQLYTLAKSNLANQIIKESSNKRFFVFNPLGWTRTDYTDFAYSGALPVHIVDVSNNTEIRSQIININGNQYIRILAPDVPSVGYKVFEIVNGAGTSFPNAGSVDNTTRTLDNDYFSVVFTNSGTITSLIDKTNGNKELVNVSSDTDYVNNIGRSNSFDTTFGGNDNSNGSFTVENNGPVSLSVKITSTSVVNHETTLTVFKNIPRLEIDNTITQNFGNNFIYNSFSFNNTSISSPTIWHEENGAVINAKKVSSGGHYADAQARYDWLTLNHFAAVSSNGNYGVTLSNQDCYFMETGKSNVLNLDENTARIKVLVAGRVNGFGLDSQGNDALFHQRYAISTYNTYSATNSMKTALEHQNGFITTEITNTSGSLPADNFSFMSISDPNTLLWALKPAEDGMDTGGAVVRVWNLANSSASNNFVFHDSIRDAKNITHIETDLSAAAFSHKTLTTTVGKNQLKSYRVRLVNSAALPITLITFYAIKQNGINKLNWEAQVGSNFSHFIVERSLDGNAFDSIAMISGSDAISLYNYEDNQIEELNTYYYRLKLVEKDGSFIYSDIKVITVDKHTKDILLYPNPVQDHLKFLLTLNKKARYDVWINDITGKTIMKLPSPLFEVGNNYFSINTGNLPTGTYTLIVQNTENKYIRKFIKH